MAQVATTAHDLSSLLLDRALEWGFADRPALRWEGRECHMRGRPANGAAAGRRRRPRASTDSALRHEDELALGRRALQQLVRVASLGQRQALRDDRVDLALAKQLEQRPEVLAEPIRVERLPADCSGSLLALSRNFWIW